MVRKHGHCRESQPHRSGQWFERYGAEEDVADDAVPVFGDQRDHGFAAGTQTLNQVCFRRSGEGGLVHAPDGGSVLISLGPDQFHVAPGIMDLLTPVAANL
jgi:hypothetical protein